MDRSTMSSSSSTFTYTVIFIYFVFNVLYSHYTGEGQLLNSKSYRILNDPFHKRNIYLKRESVFSFLSNL